LVEVVLAPSLVQGEEAPASLVKALRRLDRPGEIDVILLARGGGSLEDLWAFNDEAVARAVAASRVPVVTGVGHETDFTIVDFVADLRAPTPTAAAAAVVPDASALRQEIAARVKTLESLMRERLARLRERLDQEKRLLARHHPRRALMERRQRLDDLLSRGTSAIRRLLSLRRIRLEGLRARLDILDPRAVLSRGFAMVEDAASGRLITRVEEAWPGQEIYVHIHQGRLDAQVHTVSPEGPISQEASSR
jgi:exodeoxyribonuclease VII large subunit